MGFRLQAIMLIYDWKMTCFQSNFSKKNNKKINKYHCCPFISFWPNISRAHLWFSSVEQEPSAEEVEDAGPSPWRKRHIFTFSNQTMLTGFTCGVATCIPSRLFVRNTFHSEISSMCTFVRLDLEQNKLVERSDLSMFN